jgi:hypothetical protein
LNKHLKGRVEEEWGRKRKWFTKFAIIICHMGPKLQQDQSMLELGFEVIIFFSQCPHVV